MARPTDYSEDMLLKANEYIGNAVDTADSHGKMQVRLPKAEGLALYLGVSRRTLYTWAEAHDEFSHILERINAIQADRVIDRALDGSYNANIAKLLLGKHGYSDKSEVDHTSKGEKIGLTDEDKKKLDVLLSPSNGDKGTDTVGG